MNIPAMVERFEALCSSKTTWTEFNQGRLAELMTLVTGEIDRRINYAQVYELHSRTSQLVDNVSPRQRDEFRTMVEKVAARLELLGSKSTAPSANGWTGDNPEMGDRK